MTEIFASGLPTPHDAGRRARITTLSKVITTSSFWLVITCRNPVRPRSGRDSDGIELVTSTLTFSGTSLRHKAPSSLRAVCAAPFVQRCCWLLKAAIDTGSSAGLLKSDPGLLYYLTQRVVDSGGGAPDDWRADPRIEYPSTVDIPATIAALKRMGIALHEQSFARSGHNILEDYDRDAAVRTIMTILEK